MTAVPKLTNPDELRSITDHPSEPQLWLDPEDYPNVEHLITEDDTALDNLFVAKQQRLLVESLYGSRLFAERTFIADSNVGVFTSIHKQAIVPDVFLSLDVNLPPNFREKRYRSYFIWEYDKAPDVVIEIISDLRGDELGKKMADYARMGVRYYVIFDPARHLKTCTLRTFSLNNVAYEERAAGWFSGIGIGLTLWDGAYEGAQDTWLRWCHEDGTVIPTSAEYAEQERQRAEQEHQRAERLLAQLRALGVEPAD